MQALPETGGKVVYGTELHKVLNVKSRYTGWVRNRLFDCDAIENEDFEGAKILAPSGQSKLEHIIKLDTAKEMAMLGRNEKGKQNGMCILFFCNNAPHYCERNMFMDSFISWVGGKKLLRNKILSLFPGKEEFNRYVEVFGGAGWVLFASGRHAETEIYNDMDGRLVNMFRCVKYHPDALQKELEFTLNSREQFFLMPGNRQEYAA